MSLRRVLVGILFTSCVVALSVGTSAQSPVNGSGQSSTGTSLLVPVSGVANGGAMFSGTLLVQRFVAQANGVAASGTIAGVLTAADGSVRNLVFQATLPLDINSSLARLNTDPALAQSSCSVLHVELAGMQMNVLGSIINMNPAAFDIASAVQAGATTSGAAPASTSASATLTNPLSANATQVSATPQFGTTAATPGPTPAPAASAPAQAQSLGSLLCAVDGFRNATNPTQLVQQLNGIVTALSSTSGS